MAEKKADKKPKQAKSKTGTPRHWLSGQRIKTTLAKLGMGADKGILKDIGNLGKACLKKFAKDRTAIDGDDGKLPHANFPVTPFLKELKQHVSAECSQSGINSNLRWDDMALQKAAKSYQASFEDELNKLKKVKMARKGGKFIVTADTLAGRPAPEPEKKEKGSKRKKKSEDGESVEPKSKKPKKEKKEKKVEKASDASDDETGTKQNGSEKKSKTSDTESEKEDSSKKKRSKKEIMKRASQQKAERMAKKSRKAKQDSDDDQDEDESLAKLRQKKADLEAELQKIGAEKERLGNERQRLMDEATSKDKEKGSSAAKAADAKEHPIDSQTAFLKSAYDEASKRASAQNKVSISRRLFINAYKRLAESNPEIDFTSFKDKHWDYLNSLIPSFNLGDSKNAEKFKNGLIKLHDRVRAQDLVATQDLPMHNKDEKDVRMSRGNQQILHQLKIMEAKAMERKTDYRRPFRPSYVSYDFEPEEDDGQNTALIPENDDKQSSSDNSGDEGDVELDYGEEIEEPSQNEEIEQEQEQEVEESLLDIDDNETLQPDNDGSQESI